MIASVDVLRLKLMVPVGAAILMAMEEDPVRSLDSVMAAKIPSL